MGKKSLGKIWIVGMNVLLVIDNGNYFYINKSVFFFYLLYKVIYVYILFGVF